MPPGARRQLQQFLEWNEQPENRFYHYDYYRDNCSTRVRDALDRALGGRIRAADHQLRYRHEPTGSIPIGSPPTIRRSTPACCSRWGTRSTGRSPPGKRCFFRWRCGSTCGTSRSADRTAAAVPLVRSERTLFESTEPTPPTARRSGSPPTFSSVFSVGGGSLGPGRSAHRTQPAGADRFRLPGRRVGAASREFAGLMLAGLWGLTDHAAAYQNENVLQFDAAGACAGLVGSWTWSSALGPAGGLYGWRLLSAGFSVLGLVLKLLPGFDQVNGQIIALALPAQLGLAASISGGFCASQVGRLVSLHQRRKLASLPTRLPPRARGNAGGVGRVSREQPVQRVIVMLRLVMEQDQPAAPRLRGADPPPAAAWNDPSRRGPE